MDLETIKNRLIVNSVGQIDFPGVVLTLKNSVTVRRIFSGTFWNAISNLFGKGISFIGTVIIIRLLGREAFGEFGMLNTTISMFGMFTTFSISQTATKYIAQYRSTDKDKAGRIIGVSFLFSASLGFLFFILVFIFADLIALKSLNAPHLSGSLKLMAIGLFFGAVNGVQNGIIAGFEAFKTNALYGIFSGTILTGAKVLLTYLYGFKGAVIGMTIEPVFIFLIVSIITRKLMYYNMLSIKFRGVLKESGILLNYSLPSMLTGFFYFPTNWFVMTILAKSNYGYNEVGAYNAANQWYSVLLFVPYILVSTFLPVFSEKLAINSKNEVNRIILITAFVTSAVFIILSLGFLLFGNKIALIYGNDFKGTGLLLTIAVFTLFPQSINIILGNLVSAMDEMWFSFWVNFLWCVAFIGLTYLFISAGAMGILLARLIAFGISMVLMVVYYINWKNKYKVLIQ
ncbi:MAG TPA: oligosaccharide flippase family protein [Bacteroidales bacterium]|nr:oligosaccharide flippase family protein [Bacteroidales bacterium]